MDVLVTRHVFPAALELLRPHVRLDYHDAPDGLPPAELKVAAATASGVLVTNTPGVLTESTADLTFALLMAVARRLPEAERYLRDGRWRKWAIDLLCGDDIHDRVLGIVGMGRIGQAVARRAAGFAMEILYCESRPLSAEREQELGATAVPFDELLARSDFVTLHVPANDETRHMIGQEQLARMKKTAFLINTARGTVVDERALAVALRAGQIAGAGLDVFANEPEVEPLLLELPNVVLLPHVASASVATRTKMCTMAAESILAVLANERPRNLVNPEALGNDG
ncbi:MAG: 2-hydroxyacid dehydrogenase [Planctomycetota bacterium]|jgi:glyoxylate reductase